MFCSFAGGKLVGVLLYTTGILQCKKQDVLSFNPSPALGWLVKHLEMKEFITDFDLRHITIGFAVMFVDFICRTL